MNLCVICGKPLEGRQPHAKYHKGECQREIWRRESARKRAVRTDQSQGWKEPRQCSECPKVFLPRTPKQETCGDEKCLKKRKRRMEKLRAQGVYQRDTTMNTYNEYQMADPWPDLDYLPPGQVSWYSAQMMPVI